MASNSKIEWTEATWNPVTGCTKVSPGCAHCYAERIHEARHRAHQAGKKVPKQYATPFSKVVLHPERLELPPHWKKPRRVFVNSMSDLFHEAVPNEFIDRVFVTMWNAQWHTFQVLTKRADRMRAYMNDAKRIDRLAALAVHAYQTLKPGLKGVLTVEDCREDFQAPLPNVVLMVSAENQEAANQRIPLLLQCPAALYGVSLEPLLGPVDLLSVMPEDYDLPVNVLTPFDTDGIGHIGWVIVGGESGPKARPMHPDWARAIRDQCVEAGVPFFFKQWGEWLPVQYISQNNKQLLKISVTKNDPKERIIGEGEQAVNMVRVGKKKAGRLLDGREWNEYPPTPRLRGTSPQEVAEGVKA